MRKTYRILSALGLAGGMLYAGAAAAPTPTRHDTGSGTTSCNTDPPAGSSDAGTMTWSPTNLWPPNGKLVPVTITFTPSSEDSFEKNFLTVGTITSSDGGGSSTGSGATAAESSNNQTSLSVTVSIEASR